MLHMMENQRLSDTRRYHQAQKHSTGRKTQENFAHGENIESQHNTGRQQAGLPQYVPQELRPIQ
jgi:hypothetical protein